MQRRVEKLNCNENTDWGGVFGLFFLLLVVFVVLGFFRKKMKTRQCLMRHHNYPSVQAITICYRTRTGEHGVSTT